MSSGSFGGQLTSCQLAAQRKRLSPLSEEVSPGLLSVCLVPRVRALSSALRSPERDTQQIHNHTPSAGPLAGKLQRIYRDAQVKAHLGRVEPAGAAPQGRRFQCGRVHTSLRGGVRLLLLN